MQPTILLFISLDEFAERVLQVYDLFNMADPLMFAQELERYTTLYVFKAGLPEDYTPHITKILQELGVRTMDRDQQLMHIITKFQNYHEFVISVKHDTLGTTSTPGWSAISGSMGHTPPQQAQQTRKESLPHRRNLWRCTRMQPFHPPCTHEAILDLHCLLLLPTPYISQQARQAHLSRPYRIRRIGIPILQPKIALNIANGANTILGVTPPLLLSYGSK
ncbi:hypothetical protein CEUSTIGMA_g4131.t1 [Chlamydomonas eustigma]|uniref:Uncharacterized protein n=1 Tax=Chlamydomonas eustigma TaxID=1157962 RepID=A0A250X0V8_9CHLO|nr:hypothetical protein CEUSTIGMA_g4131.t1 [Chlamydomonas eustigma]|eukprot:GAX76685.1 hypothetical protein CEUSTIGMA_g4131.t1 [Chlamydomonas eustigma]